jgi:L-iditol 2-dehydrogenase
LGLANALVIGGGSIGVSSALSLRELGIWDVIVCEPNEIRRSYLTKKCGPQTVCSKKLDVNTYFDVVIDRAGFESSRKLASARAQPGGAIVHIGLGSAEGGLDIRRLTLQEITFIGSYTYTHQDFREAAQAMFDGQLGSLNWAVQRLVCEGQLAFEQIRSGSIAAPKTILKPN